MICDCIDGVNCTEVSHKLLNGACDEYVDSLRQSCCPHPIEDKLWQAFYGEGSPGKIKNQGIEVWRKYYDNMEDLDRSCYHSPSRQGSNSVIPTPNAKFQPHYNNDARSIRDRLHRYLGRIGQTPTGTKSDDQHIALREHERDLKPCDCDQCKDHRRCY